MEESVEGESKKARCNIYTFYEKIHPLPADMFFLLETMGTKVRVQSSHTPVYLLVIGGEGTEPFCSSSGNNAESYYVVLHFWNGVELPKTGLTVGSA